MDDVNLYLLLIFFLLLLFEILFFIFNLAPLDDNQIKKLSENRQKRYTRRIFEFEKDKINYAPTKEFKSSIKPNGEMYKCDIPLKDFPFFVAQLLKGKKHEWVIIAFEKNQVIEKFWVNKGPNNERVSFSIDREKIIDICISNNYSSVLRLHNHPNSDPKHYTHLIASDQDYYSAKHLSEMVLNYGINWVDFVCERGRWLMFYKTISDKYFPGDSHPDVILTQNGKSKFNNYLLHREADGLLPWQYLILILVIIFAIGIGI